MGRIVPPQDLVAGPRMLLWLDTPPWAHVFNREMLYSFGWMFPLALFRLGRLPRPWLLSSATTLIAISVIAVQFAVRGNINRPVFNVIAPMLVLSVALLLAESLRPAKSTGKIAD